MKDYYESVCREGNEEKPWEGSMISVNLGCREGINCTSVPN